MLRESKSTNREYELKEQIGKSCRRCKRVEFFNCCVTRPLTNALFRQPWRSSFFNAINMSAVPTMMRNWWLRLKNLTALDLNLVHLLRNEANHDRMAFITKEKRKIILFTVRDQTSQSETVKLFSYALLFTFVFRIYVQCEIYLFATTSRYDPMSNL
jgi:hypothetical protein